MEITVFEQATDIQDRILKLNLAIERLEKAFYSDINVNGIKNDTSNLDHIVIDKDLSLKVSKSDRFFMNIREQTILFLKGELTNLQQEFESL